MQNLWEFSGLIAPVDVFSDSFAGNVLANRISILWETRYSRYVLTLSIRDCEWCALKSEKFRPGISCPSFSVKFSIQFEIGVKSRFFNANHLFSRLFINELHNCWDNQLDGTYYGGKYIRRKNFVSSRYWGGGILWLRLSCFLRLRVGRIGHYGECGETEIACWKRSDLLLGVLLDSEDKWGLKGGNGWVGRNGWSVYDLLWEDRE